MTAFHWIAAIVALLVFGYLVVAMLAPEKLS